MSANPSAPADHVHIVPVRVLAGVFALLMALTLATVAATWVDLGQLNIGIALGIAFIKALFVCLYFMHLRYDSPFYSLVLATALIFVVLFVGLALLDTQGYEASIEAAGQPRPVGR